MNSRVSADFLFVYKLDFIRTTSSNGGFQYVYVSKCKASPLLCENKCDAMDL